MSQINEKIISFLKKANTKNITGTKKFNKKEMIEKPLKKHEVFWMLQLKVIMKSLIKKRLHLGQHKSYVAPKMEAYLLGYKNNFGLIDLNHTIKQLRIVLQFLYSLGTKRGTFMVIGTQEGMQEHIKLIADKFHFPYTNGSCWTSGLITNTKSIQRAALLGKNNDKASKRFLNLQDFNQPDVLIILNPQHNQGAINEANIKNIPIIALVDTHCSLKGIDYPIICNNESILGVFFLLQLKFLAYKYGYETIEQKLLLKSKNQDNPLKKKHEKKI